MPEQRRNSAMISTLSGEFQRRYEAAFAWKSACSAFLALPGLRGFWPMSSFNEAGNAYDLSGQGRVLTYNGNPTYNYVGLAPYIDLDGTGDFLSRADEAGLDILGTETYVAAAVRGLTLGGWWNFDSIAGAGFQRFYCKDDAVAERSYSLVLNEATDTISFEYFTGAAAQTIVSVTTVAATTWYFIVGRFIPSTSHSIVINSTIRTLAHANASIDNSGASLFIGRRGGGTQEYAGLTSLVFLCAATLSDTIILSLFHQTRAAFGI